MLLRSPARSNALYFRAVSLVSLRLFISALPPASCSTWSLPSAFPVHIVPCSTSCPGIIKNVGDDADRSLGTPASMRAKTHRWPSGGRGVVSNVPLLHCCLNATSTHIQQCPSQRPAYPCSDRCRRGVWTAPSGHRAGDAHSSMNSLGSLSRVQRILGRSPWNSLGNNGRHGPPS